MPDITKPQISVVMAVRNGMAFVQAAIDSILRQDFRDFEFLIVDDGSTDATAALLDRQTDPRLRVFHRPHCGLPAALNFAIAASRADLIARQDADDLSEPSRLRVQQALLLAAPDAPLAHCAAHALVGTTIVAQRLPYVPRSQALTALCLCTRSPVTHGTAMFRKRAFREAGGYNETFLQAQDFDLWGRLIQAGRFLYSPKGLYQFRQHSESVSVRKAEAQERYAREIGRNNCRRLFRTDATEADQIFDFLTRYPEHRTLAWLPFIRRDLPRLRYQSAELYLWVALQMARAGRKPRKTGT